VSDETDCVSDLYVGRERASWIDLGAGPFAWGPLVGGSGLRGATDLPDVDLRFNRGLSDAEKAAHRPTPDARLREELEAAAAESEASIDPRDELQVFRAQMDVYTSFAKKHCESRATRIKLCDDLKRKTRELSVAIAEAKDGDVQPEDADFSLFGRDDLPPNVTIARDVFASELGRVLSSHLTRVVAPATAPGPRRHHERVHVTVYFVAMGASDPSRSPYGTDAFGGFDVEKFESEARGLMLRDQKLEFSAQRLRCVFLTPVPVRPRPRGERRSLKTFSPCDSLRPGSLAVNPDTPRRLSTPLLTPFNSTPTSLRTERPSARPTTPPSPPRSRARFEPARTRS
jgi:hypothetical protein